MSSRWLTALAVLILTGCAERVSGEWEVTAATLGSGANAALADVDGTLLVERDGTASLDLLAGDPEGDFLEMGGEGVAETLSEQEFTLVLTGYQEVPQNAIFIDLDLGCVFTELDASCEGLWESLGLESQAFSVELSAL